MNVTIDKRKKTLLKSKVSKRGEWKPILTNYKPKL